MSANPSTVPCGEPGCENRHTPSETRGHRCNWCHHKHKAREASRARYAAAKANPKKMDEHREQSKKGMRKVYDKRHEDGLTTRGEPRQTERGPKRKPREVEPPPGWELAVVVPAVPPGDRLEAVAAKLPKAPAPKKAKAPRPTVPPRSQPDVAPPPPKAKRTRATAVQAPSERPAIQHIPREERRERPKCHLCMSIIRDGQACARCGDRAATPAGNDLRIYSKPYTKS